MQTTASGRHVDGSNRTIARIVGVLFISAFFAYGGGNALIASIPAGADHLSSIAANATSLRAGALLMLMNSLVVAAIGVLMLRVARPYSETIAFGYLTARLVESVFLAVGVVFLLLQLALAAEHAAGAATASLESLNALSVQGNFVAYQIGMIGLGLGSVPFWYVFYRARLIPRILAALGIAKSGLSQDPRILGAAGRPLVARYSAVGGCER